MSDLTAAIGVTKPSLYAAFGNTEQLSRKVLDRYDQRTAGFFRLDPSRDGARIAVGLFAGG